MSMEQQAKSPPDLKKVAQFLRSGSAGIKVRVGALNGKRIDYFKGKRNERTQKRHSCSYLCSRKICGESLLSPAYAKQKNMPKITSETEALTVLNAVNAFTFFLRVQRGGPSGSSSSSPKSLQIIQEQKFAQDEYYAWFYDGSQWTTVMFPLWPPTMRLGVWYLSMGMLGLIGLFFGIAVLRLIFYIITVIVASPGIWVFPQLFADVGFVSTFFRLASLKKSKKKKGDKSKDKSSDAEKIKKNGGAFVEEVADDSGDVDVDSRPQSRSAKVEEVEDEDD
ncbi:translocation protein Sec62-domain-containing protein [Rhodocollybia butyracea]|uniref:Translocation protein SEC62 n=1 Tax=Rhodocollybia butyracea TaxID=206335 RepID=A0A9P5U652_9AGAR|nr:translocation protein Sec62-domain-containing protein [Rhodocollybia butyracea]